MSRLMQEFGQHSNLYHSNLIILKPTCSVSLKMDQTGYNYKEMHKRNGCWVFFTALLQLQIRNPLVRQRTANRYYQWWCYQFTFHRDIQLLSPAHLPNENDPKTSKAVTLPSSLLQDLLQRYSFVSNMYFESTIFWIQIHLPHFVWHSVDISLAALLLSQFPSSAFHSEYMHNVAWKHPDYAKYTAKPEDILWFEGCNNMSSRATMKLQISWSKNFQHSAEMWSILEGIWKLKNVSDLRKALSSLRRFNSFSRSGTFATSALTVFTMAMSCSWRARRRSNSCHSAKREISRKK